MTDGLYRVTTSYLCAGFVVESGRVTRCAPVLRKRLSYWMTIAVLISGCAQQMPACVWIEVTPDRLAQECNDWSLGLRGCQKGATTCTLYVRKP
jgi:hypothetical protein